MCQVGWLWGLFMIFLFSSLMSKYVRTDCAFSMRIHTEQYLGSTVRYLSNT